MKIILCSILVLWLLGAQISSAVIVDHTDIPDVAALPQIVMNAISSQTWLFTHASVGANMCDGMDTLHSANPSRFSLVRSTVGTLGNDDSLRAAFAPAAGTAGTIYDCNRGNPGWLNKMFCLSNSVCQSGWHDTAVDLVMDKLCYIDQDADAAVYLSLMTYLESLYPLTRFVYTTMPLTTDEDSNNRLRNEYNATVRAYCSLNAKLLFDIADMESYDTNGSPITFSYGGNDYQKLWDAYSDDGGHLNALGREQIALGWYATAATQVIPEPAWIFLLLVGTYVTQRITCNNPALRV